MVEGAPHRLALSVCPSPDLVKRWFNDAGVRIARADCEAMAREIQIAFNRANNKEIERHADGGVVPRASLRDVSPTEERAKRVRKFMAAANNLLAEARELEAYSGNGYYWSGAGDGVSLQEIVTPLLRIGAVARPLPPAPCGTQRGRPREAWHAAGRSLARLVQGAVQRAGQARRLRMKDPESITASVGAAAISWAYRLRSAPMDLPPPCANVIAGRPLC